MTFPHQKDGNLSEKYKKTAGFRSDNMKIRNQLIKIYRFIKKNWT